MLNGITAQAIRDNVNVIIVRPTMVGASKRYPYPGYLSSTELTDLLIGWGSGIIKYNYANKYSWVKQLMTSSYLTQSVILKVSHLTFEVSTF